MRISLPFLGKALGHAGPLAWYMRTNLCMQYADADRVQALGPSFSIQIKDFLPFDCAPSTLQPLLTRIVLVRMQNIPCI